jgi:hypothetical protein
MCSNLRGQYFKFKILDKFQTRQIHLEDLLSCKSRIKMRLLEDLLAKH